MGGVAPVRAGGRAQAVRHLPAQPRLLAPRCPAHCQVGSLSYTYTSTYLCTLYISHCNTRTRVRVELVKPSDESTSEPLDFYYTSSGGQEEGEWRPVIGTQA